MLPAATPPTDPAVKAVILAAGKGTRMGDLTRDTPKPLIPVAGRPALTHILGGLCDQGFRDVVMVTGYRGDALKSLFRDGKALGLSIEYLVQEVLDGTARALLLTREAVGNRAALMTFGDILIPAHNYQRLRRELESTGASVVAAVRRMPDPAKGAAVYCHPNFTIERIVEKPPPGSSKTPFGHAGLYAFTPDFFGDLDSAPISPRGEYEIADAVNAAIGRGAHVRALELEGYWKDIGTPEDLREAEHLIAAADTEPPTNPR